ncbi:zinc-binding dehydrogenase [Myxococcota bacterium]|nr:zinc-binding dehydrogenase [Myxococcota bacterium]
MRAIRLHRHGGPEVLETVELPTPVAGPDQVTVRVSHVGLNHLDLWVRRGVPGHRFPLPLVPGSDVVGHCVELDAPVALQPGFGCGHCDACLSGDHALCRDYVIRGERGDGGMAEVVVVPRAHLLPLPRGLDPAAAASLPLSLLTAWHMVHTRARVRPGQRVLVQAGASGTGAMAIQVARLLGARVLATAGSPQKREACLALGADLAVPYEEAAQAARDWTGKQGVDVVVDHVGAETFQASQRSLRWGGTYVTCGATTGNLVSLDLRALFFKQVAILGSTMGGMAELRTAWRAVADGAIRPVLDRVLPMTRLAQAHALLEERQVIGKIVVAQDLSA